MRGEWGGGKEKVAFVLFNASATHLWSSRGPQVGLKESVENIEVSSSPLHFHFQDNTFFFIYLSKPVLLRLAALPAEVT